ncbi:MAG: diaminopimelate epimerase [Candidatus Nanopelagicales bacterium]
MSTRLPFTKGHGTGNDFVLLPDPDDQITVTAQAVQAVCDRRFGIGGDGLIRVVPQDGRWFMDYHNADGSIGEMCGNGARVFAAYLRQHGLIDASEFEIGTRGGVRQVAFDDHLVHIDMGAPRHDGGQVTVSVGERRWPAQAVFMPNPHAVVFVDDLDLNLEVAPQVASEIFPAGQNVEFVVVASPGEHARMRVHERGVGETLSCGTGICAVADQVWAAAGVVGPARVRVDVPGGTCWVQRTPSGSLVLIGPAALVADGELSHELTEMFA